MAQLLVVEDNEALRELMALALRLNGFTVHEAASLDAALAVLAHESIDLILSDLPGRPAGGSLGRVRLLHEAAPAVPLILVTGYTLPKDVVLADFGISMLIPKPYDFEDLIDAIRRQLARVDRWLDRPA